MHKFKTLYEIDSIRSALWVKCIKNIQEISLTLFLDLYEKSV